MDFEKQFNKTRRTILIFARRFSRATNIPKEEFESAMCEEFSKKYDGYDGRISFEAYIKPILHQCSQRVAARKERKFYDNVIHVDSLVDEDGIAVFEFADKNTAEDVAIKRIEKSPDKLLLIRALTSKADEFTVAAVNLILEKPNASMRSIAEEMGVHHSKVTRCISRLAKNYDSKRFGDVSQYLAV